MGTVLCRFITTGSQRKFNTAAAIITRVNITKYVGLFDRKDVFGDALEYTHMHDELAVDDELESGEVDANTQFPTRKKDVVARVFEVINLHELKERAQTDPETTGERRHNRLMAWIRFIEAHGKRSQHHDQQIWMVERIYFRCDGFGAA